MKISNLAALLLGASFALAGIDYAAAQTMPGGGGGSGGGACSSFGTTAGTCAQGNDSRITGAVQSGGALGTPSSGTATNLTGLPLSTGTTGTLSTAKGGLGADNSAATGVPLFSAGTNTMTGTTGTGNVVRATSPTLVTPVLGTPTSGDATNLTNIPVNQAKSGAILPAANGGAGTVSGILKANGSGTVSAAVVGTDYASGSVVQNAQTSTSYATLATDGGKVVSLSNASAIAVSLSQANQTGFTAGFGTEYDSIGAGTTTITATTSVFDNGLTTLALTKGQDAYVWSDGTNYHSVVSVPVLAADNILGNFSGTSNYPIAGALPNCANDGAHGLVYSTSTHAFACSSITGGTGSPAGSNTQLQFNNSGAFGAVSPLTWDGSTLTFSQSNAASTPALLISGTPYSGGTTSTTWPMVYIWDGAASTPTLSTSGTVFGINAPSTFGGNIMSLWKNGGASPLFYVNSLGQVGVGSTIVAGGNIQTNAGQTFQWSTRGILTSKAAGNVQIGNTDSASPVAGTLSFQAGAGTNIAGQNSIILGSLGSGNANSGDLILQTGGAIAGSGSTAATPTNAVTIKGVTGETIFNAPIRTKGYTVSALPTGNTGDRAYVTDAVACTFLGALTGGGSTFCPVIYNGSAWVAG